MGVLIFQFSFSVTTQSSVARNLKGCQTVAEGKATGRHPRKASANLFDPGGVAEFPDIFVSGNPRMRPACWTHARRLSCIGSAMPSAQTSLYHHGLVRERKLSATSGRAQDRILRRL